MRVPNKLSCVVLGATIVGCTMDNPAFDQVRDAVGGTAEGDGDSSSGDGDGDPTTSTGDGDGDPTGDGDGDGDPTASTGDGDGDPTGDGDGDGDGDGEPCPEGTELCNGACMDLQFNEENCGECGNPCLVGEEKCGMGMCLPKKYVFVTSEHVIGDFGGLEVAYELCNNAAFEGQLPGTYRPWISEFQAWPAQTIGDAPVAYTVYGGPVVAWSWPDFLDGTHEHPINRNEHGDLIEPSLACGLQFAVWTGTTDMGQPSELTCESWTDGLAFGRVGNAQLSGAGWSDDDCQAPCSLFLPIYCIQD